MGRRLRHVHAHGHALIVLALAGCEKAPPSEPAPRPSPPIPAPVPVVPPDAATVAPAYDSCSFVAIEITTQGTWVGSPPDLRCFASRLASGAYDAAWLQTTLAELHDTLAPVCTPTIELAAYHDLPIADVNATVQAIRAAGFVDVAFAVTSPGTMRFEPDPSPPRVCPRPAPGDPASAKAFDRPVRFHP